MGLNADMGRLDYSHHRGLDCLEGLYCAATFRLTRAEMKMPWAKHSFIAANVFAAIFAVFIVAPLTWTALDRAPAYTIHDLLIIPPAATPGSAGRLEWKFAVNREGCSGTFQRVITDSSNLQRIYDVVPDTFVYLPLGEHQTLNTHPFMLPADLPSGKTILTVTIRTWCNWMQRIYPVQQVVIADFTTLPKS